MSDQDEGQTLEPTEEPRSTAEPGEEPRKLAVTYRPQSEEVRRARVALRDAGYDYDQLPRAQLDVLARSLSSRQRPRPGANKGDLVQALSKAGIR